MALFFGLAVFAVIVAVGWRSVQNRRILRLQDSNGQETIIVAREGDDISSVVTTTKTTDSTAAQEIGRSAAENRDAVNVEANAAGRGRLRRVVASTK